MKKMGLIGGMSWESTELYYRNINTEIKRIMGGHHSAEMVIESVNFEEIKEMQHRGDWDSAAKKLIECARNLEKAGAEFIVICTNTMHKVAPAISESVTVPIVHLADATGERIVEEKYKTVGFLGTKFSMEDDFYVGRLKEKHNLTVLVPDEKDRKIVHQVIYDELCLGDVRDESRQQYLRIMGELQKKGAECIIEGCTEIVLLVDQSHTDIPLFDTTAIHAQKAAQLAVG